MPVNIPTPMELLQFQIDHYTDLLANPKSFEHKVFLRKELYNFKQQLQTYLN